MLVIGSFETCIQLMTTKESNTWRVWNLSSLNDFGTRLSLVPNANISLYDENFDQFFANYVLTDDKAFVAFMSVVYELYEGRNVFITISKNEASESLAESITKLIQVRYGYTCQFVNEFNDIDFDDDSEFSTNGIYTFNNGDRDRFFHTMIKLGLDVDGFI